MVGENSLPEDGLLDWHLDRLDADPRAGIEQRLSSDASFRVKSDRLQRILRPLDHWWAPPAPKHLADKILSAVGTAERSSGAAIPFPAERAAGRSRGWMPFRSVREMAAAAACIALILSAFVPGVSALRERSRRAMCAGNLDSIYRGLSAYQASFGGSLPFAGNLPGAAWLPNGNTSAYASNSRHVFLLVKRGFAEPGSFLCPSDRDGRVVHADDLTRCDDFKTACNSSYSTLNLAGSMPNLRPTRAIAYASDPNPLFVNARFQPDVDPSEANSAAHKGRGQTVLVLDGSSRWMTRPVYGPNRDNLWVLENIRRYSGTEAPTSDDDVQLVPGYPATDPIVREKLTR